MSRLRGAADQLDLLLCLIWLVPALIVTSAVLELPVPVRALFAIPLVLVLPGYAMVTALLPALELPTVERLLLSVGSSIALVILTGLVVAATGELSPARWAVALSAVTLVGLVAAWARRLQKGIRGPRVHIATMPRLGALAVAIAVLLTANVIVVSRLSAAGNEAPPPLQLWMIPAEDTPDAALVGVRAGGEPADYRLVVFVGDRAIHQVNLSLEAGESWQSQVQFNSAQRERPIYVRLYETDNGTEVRWVVLQPATPANDTG